MVSKAFSLKLVRLRRVGVRYGLTRFFSLEQEAVNYLHSGFCQAALPHREPKNPSDPWVRRNGAYQLVIRPGILPLRDRIVSVGVPYGTKARLIMIYFQTEAVRKRSQVIDLGPNMASWLKKWGSAHPAVHAVAMPRFGSKHCALRDASLPCASSELRRRLNSLISASLTACVCGATTAARRICSAMLASGLGSLN